MRPSLKKLLALALAALMLLPMTACGTGDNGPDPSESATQGQTEGETQNTDYVCDLPAELDYGGDEISIMVVKKSGREDEMLSEELGNGIISDAVYERNLAVETELGVELVFVDQTDDTVAQNTINNAVRGGDDTLDIFTIGTYCAVSPAISGCYLNLNNLEYIDLSKHYWTQDYNNMMTFTADHKQFLATSPAALSLFRLTYLTIFNRDLFAERKIPDLYETVANGDWTYEYQLSLIEDTWVDADGNGKEIEGIKLRYIVKNDSGILAGIDNIGADGSDTWSVYNFAGVKVLETTDVEELNTLPKGIYIINSKKTVIR